MRSGQVFECAAGRQPGTAAGSGGAEIEKCYGNYCYMQSQF